MGSGDEGAVKAEKMITQDEMETRRASDYRLYYSNSVGLLVSHFDAHLTFNHIRPIENGSPVVEQLCGVSMSWEHAKALANVLQKHIAAHEEEFGPLYLKPKRKAPTADNPSE